MIIKKLHDARERLAHAQAIIDTANALAARLEANAAHIRCEISELERYRAAKSITTEDLALITLEIRRDTIEYSLTTLREHAALFESERANAERAVTELQEIMTRSLDESSLTVHSERTADP